MIRKILINLSIAISIYSALVITSVGEVDNWWALVQPWFITFCIASAVGVVAYNIVEIRRYTYPLFICFLAWSNEHKIITTNFAKQSNYIYRKHNRSYSKLYEITQYLYDRIMFAEV